MIQVNFFTEDTSFKLKNKGDIREWVTFVIRKERPIAGTINFIFCSDAYLVEINKQYLNKDDFTDVISFESIDNKGKLFSDVFISVDRVTDNAIDYKCSFEQELQRVIIHGLLHVCEYDDSTTILRKQMTLKEDFYIAKYPI